MPKIVGFAFSTDFDTLKNDDVQTITINVPGSLVFTAGETKTFVGTVTLGQPDSIVLLRYTNNIDASGYYRDVSVALSQPRTGTLGEDYSIIMRASHIGGSAYRVIMSIKNPYGVSMTTTSTTEVWTFIARSIRAPKYL